VRSVHDRPHTSSIFGGKSVQFFTDMSDFLAGNQLNLWLEIGSIFGGKSFKFLVANQLNFCRQISAIFTVIC
jgi:hypothetical protein